MATYDYDLFTIGAGSGGVRASRIAAAHGARVAVCEDYRFGGTCVIRGCVPKKLLVYASSFRDGFEDAGAYGWNVTPPSFDWATLITNKNKEIDRLEGIYRNLLKNSGVTMFEGRGRLVDAHTVEVNGQRVTAATILIATGAWPERPVIRGIEHSITSNEALEMMSLPKRIIIVGGGYIAVEFAGIFAGVGSQVTELVRADNILRGFDEDIRSNLAIEMKQRGIAIGAKQHIARIEKTAKGLTAHLLSGETIETDAIMYATGRKPNTRGIGLEEAGVKLDAVGAVEVDQWSKSSVGNIYAVGDVTNRLNLTPVAIAEGHAFADTVFGKKPRHISHENVATAVFSQPPVGTVGLTEAQARGKGLAIDIYRTRFRPMKHTMSGREERSMMKLVVDRASDRVLGIHMVGADAPEIVQSLGVAITCGATKRQFDATMAVHPTAAEEFVTLRERVPEPAKEAAE